MDRREGKENLNTSKRRQRQVMLQYQRKPTNTERKGRERHPTEQTDYATINVDAREPLLAEVDAQPADVDVVAPMDDVDVSAASTRDAETVAPIEDEEDNEAPPVGARRAHKRRASRQAREGAQSIEPYLTHASPGGPRIPDLLLSFEGHVAHAIWAGAICHPRKMHVRSTQLREWVLDNTSSWCDIVRKSELSHLQNLMYNKHNVLLINAFVERWHPETNSFHMAFGEMTITLHDVYFLLGLNINGDVVVNQSDPKLVMEEVASKLGFTDDQMEKNEVRRRGFSYNNPFVLSDHERVKTLSWGSTTLSYLYRRLGEASRRDCKQMCGCITLLEAWIYAYFPRFRPTPNSDWDKESEPWAAQWKGAEIPKKNIPNYRKVLDELKVDEVDWSPFGLLDFSGPLAPSRFHGLIPCLDTYEPYMPDRVARQFGRQQKKPSDVIKPKKAYRGVNNGAYNVVYETSRWAWNLRNIHSLKMDMIEGEARCGGDVSDDYMDWYEPRTHMFIRPEAIPTSESVMAQRALAHLTPWLLAETMSRVPFDVHQSIRGAAIELGYVPVNEYPSRSSFEVDGSSCTRHVDGDDDPTQ